MPKRKVRHLRHNPDGGIDVYVTPTLPYLTGETRGRVYRNVPENIVRCAFGSDMGYLLKATDEAFNVSDSDLRDFANYCD